MMGKGRAFSLASADAETVEPPARRGSTARLPTRHGDFNATAYFDPESRVQHMALVMSELDVERPVLVRVHSECLTGDVLGSLRCDCGSQLDFALRMIAEEGAGVLVYLRQEGRGIGLYNKLRAYALQDGGLDTVEANERLGFPPDPRNYSFARWILNDLGVSQIRLLTNNPEKVKQLSGNGLIVRERLPLTVPVTRESARYLETKRERLGHLLQKSKGAANGR